MNQLNQTFDLFLRSSPEMPTEETSPWYISWGGYPAGPIIAATTGSCYAGNNSILQRSEIIAVTARVFDPAPPVPFEVKEFLRIHKLEADFHRYYQVLENNFPEYQSISFRILHDPEIPGISYVEARVFIDTSDADSVLKSYNDYLSDFCRAVAHDSHQYFSVYLDFPE